MGYCYDPDGRLCCDYCGNSGGVRKVRCPYNYCCAAAVCPECRKTKADRLRAAHHQDCKQRRDRNRAEENRYHDCLDHGGCVLFDWEDYTGPLDDLPAELVADAAAQVLLGKPGLIRTLRFGYKNGTTEAWLVPYRTHRALALNCICVTPADCLAMGPAFKTAAAGTWPPPERPQPDRPRPKPGMVVQFQEPIKFTDGTVASVFLVKPWKKTAVVYEPVVNGQRLCGNYRITRIEKRKFTAYRADGTVAIA